MRKIYRKLNICTDQIYVYISSHFGYDISVYFLDQ